MLPDVTYPGTYYWAMQYTYPGSSNPYKGKIILMFDEHAGSHDEFYCMEIGELPNCVKIGSQTLGADGNITYFNINQSIYTGFTSIGVFYPNGDSTERIGIIPDTLIYPTRTGFYHNRDEVLEKALQIAGCPLAVPTIVESKPIVDVYPNPASTDVAFKISSGENKLVRILDETGREIQTETVSNNIAHLNTTTDPAGIYFYEIIDKSNRIVGRGKFSVIK